MYFKPTYMQKTYCGNMVKNGKIIKKNVPITMKYSLNKDIKRHEKISEIIELNLLNKKYFVNLSDGSSRNNDYHGTFSLNKVDGLVIGDELNIIGGNNVYIPKNLNSISIEFNPLDPLYYGSKISAISNTK